MIFARARTPFAALLVPLLLSASPSARADLRWAASARAGWAENISRSTAPIDWKDAGTLETTVDASYPRAFARDWLVTAGAHLEDLAVTRYALLDHFGAGPRLDLQRKFGLGPYAPVLQGSAALTYRQARLDLDTGWSADGGIRVSQRLSSAFRATAGIDWTQHWGRDPTFDLRSHSASASLSWDIDSRWQLCASFARLWGEIVANASEANYYRALGGGLGPVIAAYYDRMAWIETDIYGPGWVSYVVDATADTTSLALSYALARDTALEFRTASTRTVSVVGIRYKTDTFSLGLVHRF